MKFRSRILAHSHTWVFRLHQLSTFWRCGKSGPMWVSTPETRCTPTAAMQRKTRLGSVIPTVMNGKSSWCSLTISLKSRRKKLQRVAHRAAAHPHRSTPMSKPKVLFLCTGNSARSQMAEGYLRHVAGEEFEPLSAGVEPKQLNPFAVEVMREIGIDISQQKSKDVVTLLGQYIPYVVTVCD